MISVYYEMKQDYYWPGIRLNIEDEIGKCETCQINNRKKSGGYDFVSTSRYLEKVVLDLMEFREHGVYVIVAIDYFTRRLWGRVIERKSRQEIVQFIKDLCQQGKKPEELITDNGREFINEEFTSLCRDLSKYRSQKGKYRSS